MAGQGEQGTTFVTNSFRNGLVTEATGLNFPEDACTETSNCIFNLDGSVERREGIDFEANYSEEVIDFEGGVVNGYLWRDVSGDGNIYLYAVQLGDDLFFYDASTTDPISAHYLASFIHLPDFSSPDAPNPRTEECQFSSGNGLLFVTHPFLEPFYVSYDRDTTTFTGTGITLEIRDFKGMEEPGVASDTRTTTSKSGMTIAHYYNLLNQGWTETNLDQWDTDESDMPSNSDVMWSFKNSDDEFDTATIPNVVSGNSPAPKGHYLLNIFDEDRATPSGLVIDNVSTNFQRFTTNAFFAGRVFYAGINYEGYNANIYFTQIVESTSQYGKCYQTNDPTSETLFDLLPSDGGLIVIRDAGTIIRMVVIPGGLAVFASNGVWLITGSTGLGFTATDYTVSKISSIRTLSHTSFVDISGTISWWNLEGIYTLSPGNQGGAEVKSMTHKKLLSYIYDIPPSSKRYVRGYFNTVTGVVQWLFRSTEAANINEAYRYDRILNYNTFTDSFYPWEVEGDVDISGIVVVESLGGTLSTEVVLDSFGVPVVDGSGEVVVVYEIADGIVVPKFKYFVQYSNFTVTFAEASDSTYTDWTSFDDVGVQFDSYFTSGYRLKGGAIRKFQPLYLQIFSGNDTDTQYYVKGLWDFFTTPNTGRWSPRQLMDHTAEGASYAYKRVKIRGHGLALQFKIESYANNPFHIIGWSEFIVSNQKP